MLRPPFKHFPELESPRIRMRQLLPSDAAFVLDIMVYNGKPAENIADAVAMIERIENDSQKGNTVNWVLIHKKTNEAMGTIGYYRGFANETGEIGFILKPEFHDSGYMTEALKLVTEFGWKTLQLKRVIAVTKLLNEPAVRLLERCGFRYVCPFDEVYSEFEHAGNQIYHKGAKVI